MAGFTFSIHLTEGEPIPALQNDKLQLLQVMTTGYFEPPNTLFAEAWAEVKLPDGSIVRSSGSIGIFTVDVSDVVRPVETIESLRREALEQHSHYFDAEQIGQRLVSTIVER